MISYSEFDLGLLELIVNVFFSTSKLHSLTCVNVFFNCIFKKLCLFDMAVMQCLLQCKVENFLSSYPALFGDGSGKIVHIHVDS